MFSDIIRRQCISRCRRDTTLNIVRGFGSFLLRQRLIKTDQPRIYRQQPGLASRLRLKLKLKVNQGTVSSQERSNLLKSSFYSALKRFVVDAHSVRMPPVPPEAIRGMKILDKDAFKRVVDVPTLLVPIEHVGQFQKKVKKFLFKMQGIKPVAELAEGKPGRDNSRLFLFDPEKYKSKEALYEVAKQGIDELGIDLNSWEVMEIELKYLNWHYDEILRAILPEETDGVGGFSVIGHILHINLKDELLPYKQIIGDVLLDKVSKVETVVNKTNTIDNTFRNFSMEVLAGKEDFITTSKENGFSFKMDFSKVYWNPRLNTEHQRVVDQMKAGDVLYDVFAGIGPFAVPAAKRKCLVLANDLNPESYKWLQVNMTENKVKATPQLFNLDGRDFIRSVVKKDLVARMSDKEFCDSNKSIHVVMNLPALAVEFLDAFVGLLGEIDPGQFTHIPLPKVHCYTFSNADDLVQDVKERAEKSLGCVLPTNHTIRGVRNVAPNKEMLCAEFDIQKEVLFHRVAEQVCSASTSDDGAPAAKKNRIEC